MSDMSQGPAPSAPPASAPGRRRPPPKVLAVVVVVIVVAAVVVATTSGGGSKGRSSHRSSGATLPTGVTSGPDDLPSGDLTLAADTVVVRGGGGAAVKSLGTDGKTVTLDAGAEGADKIQPGKVLIVTGMFAAKVASVDRRGGDLQLALEPATLPDVISDGELSWDDQAADLSKATVHAWSDGGTTSESSMHQPGAAHMAVSPAGWVSGSASGGSISGSFGGYEYTLTPLVSGDSISFDLDVTKGDDGWQIEVQSHVQATGIRLSGNLRVVHGHVEGFSIDAPNLGGHAEVDATAATGADFGSLSHVFEVLPISVDIPFVIAGIPFRVGLGGSIEIEPSFTSKNASVAGHLELDYSGSAGMSLSGAHLSSSGAAFNPIEHDPSEALAGIGIAPVAVVVKVHTPKVDFGLGIAQIGAGVGVDVTFAFGPSFSGAANPVPCAAQPEALSVDAELTGQFLGHEITLGETQLFQKTFDHFKPPVQACQF